MVDDGQGRFISRQVGLALVRWQGGYQGVEARWLRWAMLTGPLLPTPQETMAVAQHQAAEVQRQAAEAQGQAAMLEALLARYREQFGNLPE